MTPAAILLLVQAIQAIIQAAPQIEQTAEDAKEFIDDLFEGGVISTAQQNSVWTYIDNLAASVKAGTTPSEFQVQPDPVS